MGTADSHAQDAKRFTPRTHRRSAYGVRVTLERLACDATTARCVAWGRTGHLVLRCEETEDASAERGNQQIEPASSAFPSAKWRQYAGGPWLPVHLRNGCHRPAAIQHREGQASTALGKLDSAWVSPQQAVFNNVKWPRGRLGEDFLGNDWPDWRHVEAFPRVGILEEGSPIRYR
jgi:hypothetical protein